MVSIRSAKRPTGLQLILLTLLVLACSRKAPPCLYLLPEGFRGDFVVVHSVPDGEPAVTEDGFLVLRIPPSGVLVTQVAPFSGWWGPDDLQFHVESASGERTRLEHRATHASHAGIAADEVFVSYGRTGMTTHGTLQFRHTTYFVGTQRDFEERRIRTDVVSHLQDRESHPVTDR